MYDKEIWSKLSKQQQLSVTSASIRGAIINAFVYVESLMADITIVVDYNSNYNEYFKGFRSTTKIIEDFLICYEKIKIHGDKYFTDKESLKEDIKYLGDIRNRAAHFLLLNDEVILSKSDPFKEIYFYSIRYSKEDCCTLTGELVRDYQNKVMEFVQRFGKLQNDVYNSLGIVAEKRDLEILANSTHIKLKSNFQSLK